MKQLASTLIAIQLISLSSFAFGNQEIPSNKIQQWEGTFHYSTNNDKYLLTDIVPVKSFALKTDKFDLGKFDLSFTLGSNLTTGAPAYGFSGEWVYEWRRKNFPLYAFGGFGVSLVAEQSRNVSAKLNYVFGFGVTTSF